MNSISENSNRFRRVKSALFGDPTGKIKTWAIISTDNPLGWENITDERFRERYAKWLRNPHEWNKMQRANIESTELLHSFERTGDTGIRMGGFKYVRIKGFYERNEVSYLIFNLSIQDAKTIASNYGQQSFFYAYVDPDGCEIGYYYTTNEETCINYKLKEISKTITDETDAKQYFSKYGIKWKINMKEFGNVVPEVVNKHAFEESFNDIRPFMSRAACRRDAYRKE